MNWLERTSHSHKEDISEIVRLIVRDAMNNEWEPGRPIPTFMADADIDGDEDLEDLDDKEKFLRYVRRYYTPELAADKLGLSRKELESYIKQWDAEIQEAMYLKCLDVEHELQAVGAGQKGGNSAALKSWLEANHPMWKEASGILKDRSIKPVMEMIVEVFSDTVGRLKEGECDTCNKHWESCVDILDESLSKIYKIMETR